MISGKTFPSPHADPNHHLSPTASSSPIKANSKSADNQDGGRSEGLDANSNNNSSEEPGSYKMVIKNGVLMKKQKQRRYRTERPYGCNHCSARFTLRYALTLVHKSGARNNISPSLFYASPY